MYKWRITKYNPCYRDIDGTYLRNEWTDFSDIGKVFDNNQLTKEEYFYIENLYVESAISFMICLDLAELQVNGLEHNLLLIESFYYYDNQGNKNILDEDLKKSCEQRFIEQSSAYSEYYTKEIVDLFYNIREGQWLNISELKSVIKLILRNHFWCKFAYIPRMSLEFGWDYYMYIVSDLDCSEVIRKIEDAGLFVERVYE